MSPTLTSKENVSKKSHIASESLGLEFISTRAPSLFELIFKDEFYLRMLFMVFEEFVCQFANCGEGTCKAPPKGTLFPPFDCECNPGWKKIELFNITLPPCLLPNCTLNLDCGSSPTPPPPPPLLPPLLPPQIPPINFSDPCNYTFCGDGSCVRTDPGYICKCNEGAANLLNLPGLLCAKPCSLGADCSGLHLWQAPPSLSEAPNLGSNGSDRNFSRNFAKNQLLLTVLLLLSTFIPWT